MPAIATPAEGEWFLPSHPDMPIPGVLRIEDEQIFLTILGRLPLPWEFAKSASPEVILGATTSGARITLLHCNFSAGRESSAGARSTTFRASLLVWGVHKETSSAASPVELRVHFSDLEAWLGQPQVFADWGSSTDGQLRRPIRSYATHLVSADDLEIGVSLLTIGNETGWRLEIEDRAAIVFRSLCPRPLVDYLPLVHTFRSFLVLATSSQVRATEVIAIFEESAIQEQESDVRRIPALVTGHDISLGLVPSPMPSYKFLFSLSALGATASNVVTQWFKLFRVLEPVVTLYSFTAHRHDLIAEEGFLNAVKACESFHRSILADPASEEHEERLREILDAVPSTHRKWLKWRLRHSDEPSLQRRLEELWQFAGSNVAGFLPIEASDLIAKTVAGRNFLTHYSGDAKPTAPNLSELPTLTRWWVIILEACLLVHSGVERSEVRAFFQRQSEFYRERFLEWRDIEYHPC